jgi:hypothetical protein
MTVNEACKIAAKELGIPQNKIEIAAAMSRNKIPEGHGIVIPAGQERAFIDIVKAKLSMMQASPFYAAIVSERVKRSPYNRDKSN